MNSKTTMLGIMGALLVCCGTRGYAEIADPGYRDGVFYGLNDHAAIKYRYDNGSGIYYVIQAFGGASYAPNNVEIGTWADFLSGNNYVGHKCPATLPDYVRSWVISDALDQLNAHYWGYGPLTYCWMRPNTQPQNGDGCFRCDGLVEWVFENNGYDICNDALLFTGGPAYQMAQLPNAVDTPPTGVVMTYPSSTDVNNPTISHNSSITLQASASDAQSGLSYNKPFDYYYCKYINGSWTSWQFLASDGSTHPVTILSPGTLYAWEVIAYDNDGNSTASSVYYFKYVPQYTISTSSSPPGGGTTSGGGTYNSGSSVTVTATPNSCYNFVSWTEGGSVVSTSASYTFTANANRTLVANFSQISYTISTSSSPPAGGTTSGGGTKTCGSSVTVTATPNSCYNFVSWTEGGSVVSTSASYTFTANANRTLVANFSQISYTISTSSSPPAGGTTSGGGTKTCGSSVTVTATPNSCYNFVSWTEGGSVVSTSASYTFTANANRTLVANFSQISYTISTSSSPPAGGTTSGGGTKTCGSSVTVTATPNSCYNFVSWTEGGSVVSTSASYTFTANANRTLVANFSQISYTISTSSSPPAGGTTSGGTVACGSNVTVCASANSCYTFVNWTENGAVVSISPCYTFTASANRTLVANFITLFQAWQIQYFGSTNNPNAAAGADADGTGQNNLFKYTAGLDPTNPASVFVLKIASVPGQPSQKNLIFNPLAAVRTYTAQFTTNLVGTAYATLTGIGGPTTNGNQVTVTDLNAVEKQKFYRIDITYPCP